MHFSFRKLVLIFQIVLEISYKTLKEKIVEFVYILSKNKYILNTNKNVVAKKIPVSVNYHFTRKCNYECGFCFHTAKTSYIAPLDEACLAMSKLASMGMKKINFSGGEPFLYEKQLGLMCKFCKENLHIESVSIVSNGSKIREQFFKKYSQYVDIIAISVDSFNEETNIKIGRGRGDHISKMHQISQWCTKYNVKFKMNTVVNRFNVEEDFSENITLLRPFRWKVFQVLAVQTENTGDHSIRNVTPFLITDEEYEAFCKRHAHLKGFVPESNRLMECSYIIIDEYLRFLSKSIPNKTSKPIVEEGVNVEEEFANADYKHEDFVERGGFYDWFKENNSSCQLPKELDF